MKKLLNKIKNAALYTWQLPQNLLGLALYHCYKGYEVCTKEIGLPSLIHAGLHAKVCKDKNYYHFYTENLLFDK